MAKSSTRRVILNINGKEVEASVKQIRSEMNKLVNEQNRMVIGSDEYIAHAKKIKELRQYLKEQLLSLGSVVNELGKTSTANEQYMVNFTGRLGGIAVQARVVIKAAYKTAVYAVAARTEQMKKVVKESVGTYNTKRPHVSCGYNTPEYMHKQCTLKIKTYKKADKKTLSETSDSV